MTNGICAACSSGRCEDCPGGVVKQFRATPNSAVYEAISRCEHPCWRDGETKRERLERLKRSGVRWA